MIDRGRCYSNAISLLVLMFSIDHRHTCSTYYTLHIFSLSTSLTVSSFPLTASEYKLCLYTSVTASAFGKFIVSIERIGKLLCSWAPLLYRNWKQKSRLFRYWEDIAMSMVWQRFWSTYINLSNHGRTLPWWCFPFCELHFSPNKRSYQMAKGGPPQLLRCILQS